ncbi:MAG: hypothetical protein IKZ82_10420, partial [Clostridia bacterium]|nr:hypothetical protein [Clostridia bacterium]
YPKTGQTQKTPLISAHCKMCFACKPKNSKKKGTVACILLACATAPFCMFALFTSYALIIFSGSCIADHLSSKVAKRSYCGQKP